MLNHTTIYEATAAISKNVAQNSEGLIDKDITYLFAFRTNEEYRRKGYFSKLYKFIEEDLVKRGYKKLKLGVEHKNTQNLEIYNHLGFTRFRKENS